jgi:hypothetical protein
LLSRLRVGEGSKKLIGWIGPDGTVHHGWAHYEYGKGVGDAPGNCHACLEHHRKDAKSKQFFEDNRRLELARQGQHVPPRQVHDGQTPCAKCPKSKLLDDPRRFGLLPENELIVHLYRMASSDQRVGTMAGAFLIRSLSLQDAITIVDQYQDRFPTYLQRRHATELLMMLDRVATEVRSKAEESERLRIESAAKKPTR